MALTAAEDFWKYVEKQIEPSVEDIKNLEDNSESTFKN